MSAPVGQTVSGPSEVLPPLPAAGSQTWSAALRQSAREALRAIGAYRARSALAILGIVVGVCGVMVIAAFGRFAGAMLAAQMTAVGANLVSIDSSAPTMNGAQLGADDTLTEQDVQAVSSLPHVVAVSVSLSPHMGMKTQVVAGTQNWSTLVLGVYPDMRTVQSTTMAQGSFLTAQDETSGATTAVLGATVASRLFPDGSAVGRQVRIRAEQFTVAGVMRAEGAGLMGTDQDDVIYVPFSTAQRRVLGKSTTFGAMYLQVDQTQNVAGVVDAARNAIRGSHRSRSGGPDDFRVGDFAQATAEAEQAIGLGKVVLAGITGIALLIGGFGVANVMLASVARRTREIGVRMAVGAQRRDVLQQFLFEAAALALLGGAIGIGAGYGLLAFLTWRMPMIEGFGVPLLPGGDAVLLALVLSVGVGVVAGYLPARRAARLDPVQALRAGLT